MIIFKLGLWNMNAIYVPRRESVDSKYGSARHSPPPSLRAMSHLALRPILNIQIPYYQARIPSPARLVLTHLAT